MLAAKRGDPQIVGGNGSALLFQLQADGHVGVSSFLVDVQNQNRSNPFAEPTLIACPLAGLGDAKPILDLTHPLSPAACSPAPLGQPTHALDMPPTVRKTPCESAPHHLRWVTAVFTDL